MQHNILSFSIPLQKKTYSMLKIEFRPSVDILCQTKLTLPILEFEILKMYSRRKGSETFEDDAV